MSKSKKKPMFSPSKGLLISGLDFIKEMRGNEERVEKLTRTKLPSMDEKAPLAYEALGRLIGQIELMACCVYGCPGNTVEGHAVQYLCGRASSFGRAVLRLMEMGFYDEALSLVRSLGEIANLMGLFFWELTSLEEWKKSNRKQRRERFSPVKVRERYKRLCDILPMDDEQYRILCELSTHPVPEMTPQRFNEFDRSMTGGLFFQGIGMRVALNEAVGILAAIALFGAALLGVPKEVLNEITKDGEAALDASAGLSVKNIRDVLKSMKKAATATP